ncbi:MAG: hypothetical protein JWN38_930 [Candidatus Saccharibacteria bacterium]|nr:hypothetical protein [Candidatus Saccharibacteria bacterium]
MHLNCEAPVEKFIVLGQVPGTNIQITFTMWLEAAICVVIFILLSSTAVSFLRRISVVHADDSKRQSRPASRLHR